MIYRFHILGIILLTTILFRLLHADEGMWLPIFLKELNEDEMRAMGMRISADDIYNVNASSMKDAVIRFGRGCTGAIVSENGLILTNHHCGYGRIQAHSTVENDLLTNGFWAMSLEEELPNPGLTASILKYMKDVTESVLNGIDLSVEFNGNEKIIENNINNIIKDATQDNHYLAAVVPFYYGNQYILMVYEVFKDIRLVGAPPSYIGKFGGDTDNWMWPRHTGDFAWFRIYADKENKPADFSEDNIPYKPSYSFSVSINGVEKDDFTFILGFPGSTSQYVTSHAVKMRIQEENPVAIEMREYRLKVMEKYMNECNITRIQYSGKHAGVANYWKKMLGENQGVKNTNGIEKKQQLENQFIKWANKNETRKAKYGNLLSDFEEIYNKLMPVSFAHTIFIEGGYIIELLRFVMQFYQLYQISTADSLDLKLLEQEIEHLKNQTEKFYKNYSVSIDKEIATLLLGYYYKVAQPYRPDFLMNVDKKFKSDISIYVYHIYENSIFTQKDKLLLFLKKYNYKKDVKKLFKDPAFQLMNDIMNNYKKIIAVTDSLSTRLNSVYKKYINCLQEMDYSKKFYPDANGSLRVSYGKVEPYSPSDGVNYNYFTTVNGILEKKYFNIPDYTVEQQFYNFLKNKDFGKYIHSDSTMRVCFIASNHTTGGNSGSPVLNAKGELIGLNFDRVWEGTMSDLFFNQDFCRNISVDIRYILLITDKFANAKHLIEELRIRNDK